MAAEGEASAGPRAGALLLSKNSVTGFPCPDLYCIASGHFYLIIQKGYPP